MAAPYMRNFCVAALLHGCPPTCATFAWLPSYMAALYVRNFDCPLCSQPLAALLLGCSLYSHLLAALFTWLSHTYATLTVLYVCNFDCPTHAQLLLPSTFTTLAALSIAQAQQGVAGQSTAFVCPGVYAYTCLTHAQLLLPSTFTTSAALNMRRHSGVWQDRPLPLCARVCMPTPSRSVKCGNRWRRIALPASWLC